MLTQNEINEIVFALEHVVTDLCGPGEGDDLMALAARIKRLELVQLEVQATVTAEALQYRQTQHLDELWGYLHERIINRARELTGDRTVKIFAVLS